MDTGNIRYSRRGSVGTISVVGPMGAQNAEDLLEQSNKAVQDSKIKSLNLNIKLATNIDTYAAQILVSLSTTLVSSSRTFTITLNPDSRIGRNLDIVGLRC